MSEISKGGILYLNVMKASDTLAMDVNGLSDPYTKVFLESNQVAKTKTIDKTLNPVWDEKFCIFIPQDCKNISFEVWDHDMASSDDFMGRYDMSLENLSPSLVETSVALQGKNKPGKKPGKKEKKRGTLTFQYHYLPFANLSNLLTDPNHQAALEIIATKTPHDAVASSLIAMFQSDLPRLHALMKLAITHEVNQTSSSEQLFRTDSMATKLMKASSKLLGSVWLYEALGQPIQSICATNESVEIDPTKIMPGESVDANLAKLTTSCKDILKAILNSFSSVPAPIQSLIRLISDIVGAKFPDSKVQAVSGYVFLRFFGPGISSPEAFGLGVEPKEEAKRHLVLTAKVIQTIANGTSVREQFLQPMAPWIAEQHNIVNTKLLELAEGPSAPTPLPIPHQSAESLMNHYKELVTWISKNKPTLERQGLSEPAYEQLASSIAPYVTALSPLSDKLDEQKSSGVSNFFRSKSKK